MGSFQNLMLLLFREQSETTDGSLKLGLSAMTFLLFRNQRLKPEIQFCSDFSPVWGARIGSHSC